MSNIEILFYSIPIISGIIASYTDIKEGKIRNKVTYTMFISGIILNYFIYGKEGLFDSLLSLIFVTILITFLPGLKYGGGDKKLLMGYSVYIGSDNVLKFLFFVYFLLLIVSISNHIKEKGIKDFIESLKMEIISFCKVKSKSSNMLGAPVIFISYLILLIINIY